jgi:disulfide oxidoreductase YuzD
MPSTWRAHVIGERLRQDGLRADLDESDVYALPDDLRKAVVDTIVAEQASFPMVLVNGVVVSHGELDLDAVVRAAREVLADGCCC